MEVIALCVWFSCALKLCHGSVHLCVARPVSVPVDGHEGVNVTPVAVWGKLGVVSEDGPEKDTHICLHVHVYGGQCVRARQSGVGV